MELSGVLGGGLRPSRPPPPNRARPPAGKESQPAARRLRDHMAKPLSLQLSLTEPSPVNPGPNNPIPRGLQTATLGELE